MAKLKGLPKRVENKLVKTTTLAQGQQITNDRTYRKVCHLLSDLQTLRKAITAHYKPIKDAINGTRRTVLDLEKADLTRVQPAESLVMAAIVAWEDTPHEGEALQLREPPEGQYRLVTPRVVVEDLRALVEAISRGEVGLEAVVPHQPTLTRLAKQYGGLFRVPGCRVETNITVVCRDL